MHGIFILQVEERRPCIMHGPSFLGCSPANVLPRDLENTGFVRRNGYLQVAAAVGSAGFAVADFRRAAPPLPSGIVTVFVLLAVLIKTTLPAKVR